MRQDAIQNATIFLGRIDITTEDCLIFTFVIIAVAFALYSFKGEYKLIYNKIILKMGEFEKSYTKAKDSFDKNELKEAMAIVENSLNSHNLPSEWKEKFKELKLLINDGLRRLELNEKIDNLLKEYKFGDAEQLVQKVLYIDESFKNTLYKKITDAHIVFIKLRIDNSIKNNQYIEAITAIEDLCNRFGTEKHIKDYVNDLAKNRLSVSTTEININDIRDIINKTEAIPLLRESSFLKELKTKLKEEIYKKTINDVDHSLNEFDLNKANGIINKCSTELTSRQKKELKDRINETQNSRPYRIHILKREIMPFIEREEFRKAQEKIENAENYYKDSFPELFELLDEAKDAYYLKNKQEEIRSIVDITNNKINNFDFCDDDISTLKEKINEDPRILEIFKDDYDRIIECYNNAKAAILKEESYYGDFPIINIGGFNVPKITDEGEDADPLIDINEKRNWGIISVFDGLGGAGGVDYTHNMSKERHKGAYWASRFVRESIEKLMHNRPKGEEPLEYIEKNIKGFIINYLNEKIKEFTIANSDVKAKDMDFVFPTTMALCVYKLEDSKLTINCYWAGDSRIYLFDGHKFIFLTIDDSEAGGDPFSTVNADLPMNNKISQNKVFHINKSVYIHELKNDIPISLIATTDGCYGYYLNPIEFEHMLLSCLINEESSNYMGRIQQSVIDNGQQDDLSMAITVIGGEKEYSINNFKILAADRLNNPVFINYFNWRKKQKHDKIELENRLATLGDTVKYKRDLGVHSREFIANVQSYLSKISTLNNGAIDIGIDEIQERINKLLNEELKPLVADECYSNDIDSYKKCKSDISAFNICSKDENECWYQEYKKIIEIIGTENIKRIC